jgi:hypothetical protein
MCSPSLACLLCGRIIDEDVALAFATVVDGALHAVCGNCAARPDAPSVLAGLFGLAAPAPELFLSDPVGTPTRNPDPPASGTTRAG